MSNTIHNILNASMLKILRPLARIMMRNGVSCGSFEELVRKAYVDEAFSKKAQKQQKVTVSSVSALSGLSRKEVKRLNELEENQHFEVEKKYNRAIRVISGWTNDKHFLDDSNKPKVLSIDGEHSFATLVKLYSGDIPTKAMLDLLLSADCVALTKDSVKLIKHAYVPGNDSTEVIGILGTDTNELINTIDYNLSANENDKHYQRKVSTAVLHKNAVKEFKSISKKHSQALLEELDAWISQHEVQPGDKDARYVSLGIYYYDDSQ